MKNEIDNDFYCSASAFMRMSDGSTKCLYNDNKPCREDNGCLNYHRKYPTPEQYKEEYGEEYPDDGATYSLLEELDVSEKSIVGRWHVSNYGAYKEAREVARDTINRLYSYLIVCACTPFGKPDDDWRPQCI